MRSKSNQKMPVVFLGHGSPMNALSENKFTKAMKHLGQSLPKPRAILMISAHWETHGTFVTGMKNPRTIHDFRGFPQTLFDKQYPAPGSPQLAKQLSKLIKSPSVQIDYEDWGLDHGSWSVLINMFPKSNIPVIQLSIDRRRDFSDYLALGEMLKPLRDQGILIAGSGNIVHSLRHINPDPNAKPHDWALEFDSWIDNRLSNLDYKAIATELPKSKAKELSVPTREHFSPLLFALGASEKDESIQTVSEGFQHGSISMRSILIGG